METSDTILLCLALSGLVASWLERIECLIDRAAERARRDLGGKT